MTLANSMKGLPMASLKLGLRLLGLLALGTALVTSLLAVVNGLSAQTVILPYETDFESDEAYTLGALSTDAWWDWGSGMDISIFAPGAASSQTLSFLGSASLDLLTDSSNAEVSWVDFYLKPVFVDPLELPEVIKTEESAVTGFVKVNTQGEIYAIDGDGFGSGTWVASGELQNLQGDSSVDWIRLTYRLDYITKKWDLFVDGEMVMVDLGFLDQSVASLASFSVRADSETATQLDYFYAGNENPLFTDTSNDGLPDAWLNAQGLSIYSNQRSGDSDLDGLDNLLEYRIASDAGNPDSDGDGVNDGAEYFAGADPVTTDAYSLSALPFTENFETYAAGSLGAQGNWTVDGTSAEIQTMDVWSGSFSLSMGGDATASNALDGSGQSVVWIDLYLKPTAASESPDLAGDAAVGYYFNEEGRPIVFDGSGGNGSGFWKLLDAAQSSDWRRVTVRMDFGAQAYDFYLDGERLGAGLGFAHAQPFISRISASGTTTVDDISVDTVEPAALDDDRDGSTNAEEIAAGTNPTAFDTDGDGLADSLETLWGLNPNVADATLAQPIEVTSGVYVWTTSFAASEGYTTGVLAGQNGWAASRQNEITALEEASISDDPATDGVLERMAGMGELRRVWISFRAKLIAGDLPTFESDTDSFAGAFGASSASTLAVWDDASADWNALTTSADLTEWNDYALHFDYVDQVWTLCLNGVIVADGLPFCDQDLVTFSCFKALQAKIDEAGANFEASTAYFDDIRFANTEPANMDFDGDGLLNEQERLIGSNLLLADTDGDGMDDLWEFENGLDIFSDDSGIDGDADGLTNAQELALNTNPNAADTDGDGVDDLFEQYLDSDPLLADITGQITSVAPWILAGVGANQSEALAMSNALTLLSNGSGFRTHSADGVSFLQQNADGDFELIAKVGMASTAENNWRGGLMLRSSLDSRSAMVGIFLTKNGTLVFHDRGEDGGKMGTSTDNIFKSEMPGWLKLKRQGSVISAFTSANGSDWTLYRSATLNLRSTVFAGLAVASGNAQTLAGATFSEISLVDSLSPSLVSAYSDLIPNNLSLVDDTDGDGVSDLREISEFFSDPNQADVGSPTNLAEERARDLSVLSGQWIGYGDGRYVDTIRGELQWDVDLLESGLLELVVEAGFAVNTTNDPVFSLVVTVDGVQVGRLLYDAEGISTEESGLLLPWLEAGQHSISLRVENSHLFRKVRISDLALVQRGGTDADNDGIADWITNRIAIANSVTSTSIQSKTSPVCLTGYALHPAFTTVDGSVVQPGPNNQWFFDRPLSATESQLIQVLHENGAMLSEVDATWIPTNLLTELSPMTIRAGDSLRLVAQQAGMSASATARISVDGTTLHDAAAMEEVIHTFDQAGVYHLTAEFSDSTNILNASLTVNVVGGEFAGDPLAIRQQSRNWSGSTLDSELTVEFDDRMAASEVSANGDVRNYALRTDTVDDRFVWTRLPDNGSVVATATIRGLEIATLSKSGIFLEQTYEDGIEEIRMPVVASRVTDDMQVTLEIFIGGVLFEDGTTDKTLLSTDFDEMGVAFVRFLKSPGRSATCHRTRVYQDNIYIGRNR